MDGSRKTSSLVTTGLLASIVVFSCGCEKKESGNNRQQILEQIRSGVNNLAVLDKDNPVAHQQDANALRTILKDDRFGLLQVRPDVSSPLKVRGGSIHGDATGITTGWTGYAGCGSTETSMYCATLPHVGLENLQFYDFADTFQTVPPGKGWKIIFMARICMASPLTRWSFATTRAVRRQMRQMLKGGFSSSYFTLALLAVLRRGALVAVQPTCTTIYRTAMAVDVIICMQEIRTAPAIR